MSQYIQPADSYRLHLTLHFSRFADFCGLRRLLELRFDACLEDRLGFMAVYGLGFQFWEPVTQSVVAGVH